MGIKPTQLEAYLGILPKLPNTYHEIIEVLWREGGDLNAGELSMYNGSRQMGKNTNVINGRITEMLHMGLLREVGTRKNPEPGGGRMRTVEPTYNRELAERKPTSTGSRKYYCMLVGPAGPTFNGPHKKAEAQKEHSEYLRMGLSSFLVKRSADNALEIQ